MGKRPRKSVKETAPAENYWLNWAIRFNHRPILKKYSPEFLEAYKEAHKERLGF